MASQISGLRLDSRGATANEHNLSTFLAFTFRLHDDDLLSRFVGSRGDDDETDILADWPIVHLSPPVLP